MKFIYDPMDRRIAKVQYQDDAHSAIIYTYYTYDAGGNVMATYNRTIVADRVTPKQFNDQISLSEHHLYGSSRIGVENELTLLANRTFLITGDPETGTNPTYNAPTQYTTEYTYRKVSDKFYELGNHLGNVLAVITDRKVELTTTNTYTADVVSYSDYSPYGMLLQHRHGTESGGTYKYGFQGQEADDEIKGTGNSYNYEYRMDDPRIGRFFACDPLAAKYPWYTPYQFSGNKLIAFVELEGLEEQNVTYYNMQNGTAVEDHKSADVVLRSQDVRFKDEGTGKYYFMSGSADGEPIVHDIDVAVKTGVYTYWNADGSIKRQVVKNSDNFDPSVDMSPKNVVPEGYKHDRLDFSTYTQIVEGEYGIRYYQSTVVQGLVSLHGLPKVDFSDVGTTAFDIGLGISIKRGVSFSDKIMKSRTGLSSGSLGNGSGRIYNKGRMTGLNFGLRGLGYGLSAYSLYKTESDYSAGRISNARRTYNDANTVIGTFTPLPVGLAIGAGDYLGQKYAPQIEYHSTNPNGTLVKGMSTFFEFMGIPTSPQ
jgi:RHS repeat-associated protein